MCVSEDLVLGGYQKKHDRSSSKTFAVVGISSLTNPLTPKPVSVTVVVVGAFSSHARMGGGGFDEPFSVAALFFFFFQVEISCTHQFNSSGQD